MQCLPLLFIPLEATKFSVPFVILFGRAKCPLTKVRNVLLVEIIWVVSGQPYLDNKEVSLR